jgi:hypothetical protein
MVLTINSDCFPKQHCILLRRILALFLPNGCEDNWAIPFLGEINTQNLTLQFGGVSNLNQENMVMNPAGLGP